MLQIQTMLPEHWPAVKKIYEEGIATGNATFQTTAPQWEQWDAAHVKDPRLIAIDGDDLVAWAALSPVSGRSVYAGVAEVSVYVAAAARGKGIGKTILQALITASEKNNFWTLQAGIFPENVSSIKIHTGCGFSIIGRREKIGQMNGIWRDTLLLERRSTITGV